MQFGDLLDSLALEIPEQAVSVDLSERQFRLSLLLLLQGLAEGGMVANDAIGTQPSDLLGMLGVPSAGTEKSYFSERQFRLAVLLLLQRISGEETPDLASILDQAEAYSSIEFGERRLRLATLLLLKASVGITGAEMDSTQPDALLGFLGVDIPGGAMRVDLSDRQYKLATLFLLNRRATGLESDDLGAILDSIEPYRKIDVSERQYEAGVMLLLGAGVTLLGSFDFGDPDNISSFTRVEPGGYTGDGEADFQREAATNVLRDAHFVDGEECVLLEDDPTPCALVAPANVVITPDHLDFDGEFDAVTGTVDHYEWRIDGTGDWFDIGTSTTFSGSTYIATHSIEVRAVTPGGVAGAIGTSDDFDATSDGIAFADAFAGTGALSGNWTVEAGTCARVADVFQTSTASSFSNNVAIFTGTPCTSVDQFAKISINCGTDGTRFPAVMFRFTDAASPFYGVQPNASNGEIGWTYYTNASTFGGGIGSESTTVGATDTWGFTISGSGSGTVVRGWRNPVSDSPLSMSVWDLRAADVEITADPGVHAVDTGNFIGLGGEHHTSQNIKLDNFHAGNL